MSDKVSDSTVVQAMYDSTAEGYAGMMDAEIANPVYAETLERLAASIAGLTGAVIDTACGSGHMLQLYHEAYDPERSLKGVDLSSKMVELARHRLVDVAEVEVGDMRNLDNVASESAAAIVNFFALHHLDTAGLIAALNEWHRVLRPGGALVLAVWEGKGELDYGEEDMVAVKYETDELQAALLRGGFKVAREAVQYEENMKMNIAYIDGVKE